MLPSFLFLRSDLGIHLPIDLLPSFFPLTGSHMLLEEISEDIIHEIFNGLWIVYLSRITGAEWTIGVE